MAAGDSAKADQIAFHIYTKLFHVLYSARASELGPVQAKTDKWFNLETALAPPASTPTAELDAFRALSTMPPSRALAIQVLLVVPPPGGGTALVHKPSGTRIEPEPRYVLLEEWVLAFAPSSTSASSSAASSRSSSTDEEDTDVLPPTIYKNAIPLFRALFALLRILPAWRVVRKLTGRRPTLGGVQGVGAGGGKRGLKVVVRLRPEGESNSTTGGIGGMRTVMGGNGGNGNGETTLAFGESPTLDAGAAPLPTSMHAFPGIPHPAGELCIFLSIILATLCRIFLFAHLLPFSLFPSRVTFFLASGAYSFTSSLLINLSLRRFLPIVFHCTSGARRYIVIVRPTQTDRGGDHNVPLADHLCCAEKWKLALLLLASGHFTRARGSIYPSSSFSADPHAIRCWEPTVATGAVPSLTRTRT
ncbi:autophagy-related protein 13-domain-containing protein [Mycena haematopus]|nr:autophagy-related protein 13-domain-containing protein [Mycena haematopus]